MVRQSVFVVVFGMRSFFMKTGKINDLKKNYVFDFIEYACHVRVCLSVSFCFVTRIVVQFPRTILSLFQLPASFSTSRGSNSNLTPLSFVSFFPGLWALKCSVFFLCWVAKIGWNCLGNVWKGVFRGWIGWAFDLTVLSRVRDVRTDGRIDGRTDRQMNGRKPMDGQTDECTINYLMLLELLIIVRM